MIQKQTIEFLSNLRENNNKDWFEDHKADYKDSHQNFLEFTQVLIDGLSAFDEGIRNSHLEAKKCVMRIFRDVRFSKDKSPYKSNFFAYINKGGKKSPFGGYYLNLEPGASFFGGGIYMPESKVLASIRHEINFNFPEWLKVVEDKKLLDYFGEIKPSGKLSRPPKGYEKDDPAIEWLKFKGFYTQKNLSDQEVLDDNSQEMMMAGYQAVKPLVDFINQSVV
jgi:uncharacterized protein (TIGR02453 family)